MALEDSLYTWVADWPGRTEAPVAEGRAEESGGLDRGRGAGRRVPILPAPRRMSAACPAGGRVPGAGSRPVRPVVSGGAQCPVVPSGAQPCPAVASCAQ